MDCGVNLRRSFIGDVQSSESAPKLEESDLVGEGNGFSLSDRSITSKNRESPVYNGSIVIFMFPKVWYTTQMALKHLLRALALLSALFPVQVLALQDRSMIVPGLRYSFLQLLNNIVSFLSVTAVTVCTTLFLIGAFMMVFYAYDENQVKTGKDIMTYSLIGLVVILGSYGIMRTVLFLIY